MIIKKSQHIYNDGSSEDWKDTVSILHYSRSVPLYPLVLKLNT